MTQSATHTQRDIPQPLGPDSYTWQDFGSWRFHLMLPQAFVLQVAHPIIDAGVGEHSLYKTDPWGRAKRYILGTVSMLWFSTWGAAAITVARASQLPQKSGISSSIVVSGERCFTCSMQATNWDAPPSARSSRFTEVITTCFRPRRATASPSR